MSRASDSKSRQARKIGEIADTLVTVGYRTLDEQAQVLGLSRSTTWTIVRGSHKASGLSATLINRILDSPALPLPVRHKVHEYVRDRLAGTFGHNRVQLRRFRARLSVKHITTSHEVVDEGRSPKQVKS
jgi:hypothetical protein